MREWLVILDYVEVGTGVVRTTVREAVEEVTAGRAMNAAVTRAHERVRVGNPVDGFFRASAVHMLLRVGEGVAVAHGWHGEGEIRFDPPAYGTVASYYDGDDSSQGFLVEVPGTEGPVLCRTAGEGGDAWPADPAGFWRDGD